jgi:thiamine kinase-like enzyme
MPMSGRPSFGRAGTCEAEVLDRVLVMDGRCRPIQARMGDVPEDETIMRAVQRVSRLSGREVDVSSLSGGFTNDVFLVRADDERYVLRVPGPSSKLLEINRADERYNAEMASRSGVSPDVLDYVEDLDVMVLEYINGHVPTVAELQTPDQVRRIATAVRCLHDGPRFNNDADMFARAKRWLRACDNRSIRIPDGAHSRMQELDDVARTLALHPLPSVPCHNDLAPYNFIDDGDQLWIIDFEFSGNNDPCFDLLGSQAKSNSTTTSDWCCARPTSARRLRRSSRV